MRAREVFELTRRLQTARRQLPQKLFLLRRGAQLLSAKPPNHARPDCNLFGAIRSMDTEVVSDSGTTEIEN